jgi:solute carrier family 35 protein E3
MLLLTGPFIDKLVSRMWILDYNFTVQGVQCLALSCAVAVLVNISQFMCLGRFSAISFQVRLYVLKCCFTLLCS